MIRFRALLSFVILLSGQNYSPAKETAAAVGSAISFTSTIYRVFESDGKVTVIVTRSPGSAPASVSYFTTSNGATANRDFTPVSGTLQWADGDPSEKAIEIPIIADNFEEEPQDFLVTLSDPVGASLGGRSVTQVIIEDRSIAFEELYQSVYAAPAQLQLVIRANGYTFDALDFAIEVFDGDTKLGQSRVARADGAILFNWDNIPRGSYTLRARHTSRNGNTPFSASRTIIVSGSVQGANLATVHVDQHNTTGAEDGSPSHPFTTIQKGIDNAANNGVIKVALGAYREALLIDNKTLQVLGGFLGANATDYTAGKPGDFANPDPVGRRTSVQPTGGRTGFALYNAGDTRIEGFAISGAAHGFFITADTVQQSFPKLLNNLITGNGEGFRAFGGGGIEGSTTSLELIGNEISFNKGGRGGGVGAGGSQATVNIRNNTIRGNIGYDDHGGGLYIIANGVIANNRIEDNEVGKAVDYGGWGGGLIVFGNSSDFFPQIALSNNIVTGNFAGNGAAEFFDEGARATIDHELVFKNRTPDSSGGAIYTDGCCNTFASLNQCTVADNEGIGINSDTDSSAEIKNSIFWNNTTTTEFAAFNDSTIRISYTLADVPITTADGIIAGAGNLQGDPLFANSAANDYHLKSTHGRWQPGTSSTPGTWITDAVSSPAIDAADPAADFSSETLPNGDRADLGIYGNRAETGLTVSIANQSLQIIVNGANGSPYHLESSADLLTWSEMTALTSTTGQLEFSDSLPSTPLFYRVRQ